MGIVTPLGNFIVPRELISSPIRKVSRKFLRRFLPKPDTPKPEMSGKVGHFGTGGVGLLGGDDGGYVGFGGYDGRYVGFGLLPELGRDDGGDDESIVDMNESYGVDCEEGDGDCSWLPDEDEL